MATRLAPCPSCARHIRTTDASCAFCHVELAPGFAPPRPPRLIAQHSLTRALLAFAGASSGLAMTPDCSQTMSSYGTTIFEDAGYISDAGIAPDGRDAHLLSDAVGTGTTLDAAEAGSPSDAGDAGARPDARDCAGGTGDAQVD